jgi:hypothetical protein
MRPLSLPCFHAATAWGWHFWLFTGASIAWGLAMYLFITLTARRGGKWLLLSVVGVWLTSAIPLAALAWFMEQRSIRALMNPIHGSWALVWLDPVILPILVVVSGLAWRRIRTTSPWRSPLWLVACGILGFIGAWLFHRHASSAYDVFQNNSPTNIYHDLAAYVALLGAGLYLVIPVLASPGSVSPRLYMATAILTVVALFLLWHEAAYHLAPSVYHAETDWAHWGRAFSCTDADG